MTGRGIGYVHESMAEVLNSGARRSNSSSWSERGLNSGPRITNTVRALTILATQSSAGYTPCCLGRPQSGAELQWETLLSRAASLLALDSIVTLQSSSPHSMMENRHFLVTGIRSKVLSLCWRSPFASVSSRSLRRVNNPLNNGLDRIARGYLFYHSLRGRRSSPFSLARSTRSRAPKLPLPLLTPATHAR